MRIAVAVAIDTGRRLEEADPHPGNRPALAARGQLMPHLLDRPG
jgi:hypothetical protein